MAKSNKPPYKDFPTEINILGQNWTILYMKNIVEPDDRPGLEPSPGMILGLCDSMSTTIYICTDQSKEAMKNTLIHEILHAYYHLLPHAISPENAYEGDSFEETLVSMFSGAFLDMVHKLKPFWKS